MPANIRDALYVIAFALLTAVGAVMKIPFLPYHPLTAQIIFVLLSGALLGSFLGPLSQLLFISLGLLGVPFFNELAPAFPVPALGASPEFIRIVLKAGWLEGFIAASFVVGITLEYAKKGDFWTVATALVGGFLTMYAMGLVLPALLFQVQLTSAFLGWASPFFAMDVLKTFLTIAFLLNFRRFAAFPISVPAEPR